MVSLPFGLTRQTFTAIVTVCGLVGVLFWRVREGRTAVTARKIIAPTLGMSTGFCMFFAPQFRVPWLWALAAFLVGAILLAWPLLATSRLEHDGTAIMMRRSKAFFLVILVLAAVRYFARGYFDHLLTLEQTGGLFFILAFGMILRWRIAMLCQYRQLRARFPETQPQSA